LRRRSAEATLARGMGASVPQTGAREVVVAAVVTRLTKRCQEPLAAARGTDEPLAPVNSQE
jgi:hypothetical protein